MPKCKTCIDGNTTFPHSIHALHIRPFVISFVDCSLVVPIIIIRNIIHVRQRVSHDSINNIHCPNLADMVFERQHAILLHLGGNLVGSLPDPQQVPAHNLARVLLTDAVLQQLGNEIGELAHVLETPGRALDAVEIGADADVIVAYQVANVHNVLDDLFEGVCFVDVFGKAVGLVCGDAARDEVRVEVDHYQAVFPLDQVQDRVWDVAWVRADCFCARMAEDWGGEGARPGFPQSRFMFAGAGGGGGVDVAVAVAVAT